MIYKTKNFTDKDEQYRHENFCAPIIDKSTWEQAQFLMQQRSVINPRNHKGNTLHRYAGIIKCADCGASLIARTRNVGGKTYVEYTCNTCHRYGSKYCSPHTIREQQLDEWVTDELRAWYSHIIKESEHYERIVKEWLKRKPTYDKQIERNNQRIDSLKKQIEDLIMERLNDKERREIYDEMIRKRESEIADLKKTNEDLERYDVVSREKREQLTNISELLKDVLNTPKINDINLRMLVKRVEVHQNEDKTLDLRFEFNGGFEDSYGVEILDE